MSSIQTLRGVPLGTGENAPLRFRLSGELTLLDLVLIVQEHTRDDDETVETIRRLLDSGRVRLRSSPRRSRR
jgi:hypothetical protein